MSDPTTIVTSSDRAGPPTAWRPERGSNPSISDRRSPGGQLPCDDGDEVDVAVRPEPAIHGRATQADAEDSLAQERIEEPEDGLHLGGPGGIEVRAARFGHPAIVPIERRARGADPPSRGSSSWIPMRDPPA